MDDAQAAPASGPATPPAIDARLAARLLAEQFPRWAGLPLALLDPAGSDHVIFRLGHDMALRLPRGDWAAGQAAKEHRWLPRLADGLPLAVPVPLGLGKPSPELGYPWHWSVSRWLDGTVPQAESATTDDSPQPRLVAQQLAGFLTALHRLPPAGSFLPGPHPDLAGDPLHARDADTRAAIAATADVFGADAMTAAWELALGAPLWSGPPRWFHGDFHTGNLLAGPDGRLSAVIDFGGLGMGDPACDLIIAYTHLGPTGRTAFRDKLATDDATWSRGLGWALATGLNAYTTYAATHPRVADQTSRQITQSLAEYHRITG
ncbi:aminoglycoside phosphotransferase family protein [Streptomyces sp. NPDC004111]|uniref:aminoglycoside phosphotransferase family protein n=1 Tax=Streptomyces sp. NPDC004111 TaxID=3364690 RepID=UPI0036B9E1E0